MYAAKGTQAYAQIGVESAPASSSWSPCYLMEC